MGKCIKNKESGFILRVSDKEAQELTKKKWNYTSKSAWKSFKATKKINE